jgi:hypothetical protein
MGRPTACETKTGRLASPEPVPEPSTSDQDRPAPPKGDRRFLRRFSQWLDGYDAILKAVVGIAGLAVAVVTGIFAYEVSSLQANISTRESQPVISAQFTRYTGKNVSKVAVDASENDVAPTPDVKIYEFCALLENPRSRHAHQWYVPVSYTYAENPTNTNNSKGVLYTAQVDGNNLLTCTRGFRFQSTSRIVPDGDRLVVEVDFVGRVTRTPDTDYFGSCTSVVLRKPEPCSGVPLSSAATVLERAERARCVNRGDVLLAAIENSAQNPSAVEAAWNRVAACRVPKLV